MPSVEIGQEEVHLWHTGLTVSDEEAARIEQLLPPRERRRLDHFRDPRARRQRVVSRGMLRQLLSRYLDRPPATIEFVREGEGKPVLASDRVLEFNTTHSGDLVLYGIAHSRAVGVDLEHLRPMPRSVELAHRFLSADEHASLVATPPEARDHDFLSMWVKREAFAKAQGKSVWKALERYDQSAGDAGLSHAAARRKAAAEYAVISLDYSDEYVAAVAAYGSDWKIVRRGAV